MGDFGGVNSNLTDEECFELEKINEAKWDLLISQRNNTRDGQIKRRIMTSAYPKNSAWPRRIIILYKLRTIFTSCGSSSRNNMSDSGGRLRVLFCPGPIIDINLTSFHIILLINKERDDNFYPRRRLQWTFRLFSFRFNILKKINLFQSFLFFWPTAPLSPPYPMNEARLQSNQWVVFGWNKNGLHRSLPLVSCNLVVWRYVTRLDNYVFLLFCGSCRLPP